MYAHYERAKKIFKNVAIIAACLAAILYSSWPLGFIVNPAVSKYDYASELESAHQPYNWLFITLDVATGIVLIISGYMQWRKAKKLTVRLSILGYVLFGVLVIAAAIAPYNCNSITQNCIADATQPAFIVHGLSSIFSVVFLFVSMALLSKILYDRHLYRWLGLLSGMLLAWGFIGLYALIQLEQGVKSNWVQYLFITVCSLSIVVSVGLVEISSKEVEKIVEKLDSES
jgi:hypothetical protein